MARGGWKEGARGKVGRPPRRIILTMDAGTLKALKSSALASGITPEELARRVLTAHIEALQDAQVPTKEWEGEVL
jgi:hypothetical protein